MTDGNDPVRAGADGLAGSRLDRQFPPLVGVALVGVFAACLLSFVGYRVFRLEAYRLEVNDNLRRLDGREALLEEVRRAEAKVAQLRAANDKALEDEQRLNAAVADHQTEKSLLEKQLDERTREREEIDQVLRTKKGSVAELEKQQADLNTQVAELQKDQQRETQRIERLTTDRNVREEEYDSLGKKVERLKGEVQGLQDAGTTREQLEKDRSALAEVLHDFDAAVQAMNTKAEGLDGAKKALDAAAPKLLDLDKAIEALTAASDHAKRQGEELQKAIESVNGAAGNVERLDALGRDLLASQEKLSDAVNHLPSPEKAAELAPLVDGLRGVTAEITAQSLAMKSGLKSSEQALRDQRDRLRVAVDEFEKANGAAMEKLAKIGERRRKTKDGTNATE